MACKGYEGRLQSACDGIVDVTRNHDATRRRLGLQPCRHVDAIAVEIVAFDDQVAEMQPDAENNGGVLGLILIGFGHYLLELNSGAKRINSAGKLDQRTVARQFDQPPAMTRQNWLQPFRPMGLQPGQGAVLIPAHQPRVAHDIRRKDGRQSPYNPLAGQRPPPRHLGLADRKRAGPTGDEECRRDSQPRWVSGRGRKNSIVADVPPAYLDQDLDVDLASVRISALAFQ